jgi:hypothetical protein
MVFTKDNLQQAHIKAREFRENKPQIIENYMEKIDKKKHSYFKNIPEKYKVLFLKIAVGETTSLIKKIKAKCLDCCCFEREEVRLCNMDQCALHRVRPYQNKEIENQEEPQEVENV